MRNCLVLFAACTIFTGCAVDPPDREAPLPLRDTEVRQLGTGAPLPLMHVGLPGMTGLGPVPADVIVPPLGEGVAPRSGDGGDGTPVVTQVGGWTSGPGAIKWHGGQWVIPYSGAPGSSIANMTCDVQPRADATDLIELVGPAGVVGSVIVPATSANIIIRAWILPTAFTIPDGGNIVVRHSARDSLTGAWTSTNQDLTIISCAVRAIPANPCRSLSGAAWRIRDASNSGALALGADGVWSFDPTTPGELVTDLAVPSGMKLTSLRVHVKRNNAIHPAVGAVHAQLYRRTTGSPGVTDVALTSTADSSVGTGWTILDLLPQGTFTTGAQMFWLSVSADSFLGFGDPGPLFDSATICTL